MDLQLIFTGHVIKTNAGFHQAHVISKIDQPDLITGATTAT